MATTTTKKRKRRAPGGGRKAGVDGAKIVTTMRFTPTLLAALDAMAADQRRTRSNLIDAVLMDAARAYLGADKRRAAKAARLEAVASETADGAGLFS